MSLKVAVQMDPVERINIAGDSTFALILEAQARGHELSWYTPEKLSMRDGRIIASAQSLTVQDVVGDHCRLGETSVVDLADVDVVLLRQDPPFDMAYVTTTHLLERIHPKTLVVNDPFSVRNAPEKVFVMKFPHLMAPTLITRDREQIGGRRQHVMAMSEPQRARCEVVARARSPTTPIPTMATNPPTAIAAISGEPLCMAAMPGWPSTVDATSLEAATIWSRTPSAPSCVRMNAMSARATTHVAPAVANPAVIAAPKPAASSSFRRPLASARWT
jgi:hypothetical protein